MVQGVQFITAERAWWRGPRLHLQQLESEESPPHILGDWKAESMGSRSQAWSGCNCLKPTPRDPRLLVRPYNLPKTAPDVQIQGPVGRVFQTQMLTTAIPWLKVLI